MIVTGPGTNMCSELNTTLTLLVTGVPEILKQKIVEERLVDLSFLIIKYITSLSINVSSGEGNRAQSFGGGICPVPMHLD